MPTSRPVLRVAVGQRLVGRERPVVDGASSDSSSRQARPARHPRVSGPRKSRAMRSRNERSVRPPPVVSRLNTDHSTRSDSGACASARSRAIVHPPDALFELDEAGMVAAAELASDHVEGQPHRVGAGAGIAPDGRFRASAALARGSPWRRAGWCWRKHGSMPRRPAPRRRGRSLAALRRPSRSPRSPRRDAGDGRGGRARRGPPRAAARTRSARRGAGGRRPRCPRPHSRPRRSGTVLRTPHRASARVRGCPSTARARGGRRPARPRRRRR